MKKNAPKNKTSKKDDPSAGTKQESRKKIKSSPDYSLWARALLEGSSETRGPDGDHGTPEPKAETQDCKPFPTESSALYVVSTPIGNLGDITLRALETLARADLVACEDTRVTGGLLHRYGLKKTLISYHDHNADRRGDDLLTALRQGRSVALVSDAGTPLISDPGYHLVRTCQTEGIPVVVIPGASAVLTALAGAGLPTDKFLFAGFLPPKQTARRNTIQELSAIPATLVFYETGPRLADSLRDLADILGGARGAALGRELTKLYEERRAGSLEDLATFYANAPQDPKGELVLMIAPPDASGSCDQNWEPLLIEALKTMTTRDAAAHVAAKTGQKKADLYAHALRLRDDHRQDSFTP